MDKAIAQCQQFEHFFVHCQRDNARLSSHEEISLHRAQTKEDKDQIGLRMVCGECGGFFTSARSLAQHINRRGFRHRRSKIVNYNKDTFDPNSKYQIRDDPPKTSTGPTPPMLDPRRRTASEDRQKVAAKAAFVAPPRDDSVHAYDCHFSPTALRSRYHLLALDQASPDFPTRQALHTFTHPPGFSLPHVPLTSTPYSQTEATADLNDMEPDSDEDIPASQQPHTTQETDSQPNMSSQVQPPIGAVIQIADSPTTQVTATTDSIVHSTAGPAQPAHIDMPLTLDALVTSTPFQNVQTTVTCEAPPTSEISTPTVAYPIRDEPSFIIHTFATSTPVHSPLASPVTTAVSVTMAPRNSVIITSPITSYPHLLSPATSALSTTTAHGSVIMTPFAVPSLRLFPARPDAYPYMVALVRHLEWLIRLLTTTFSTTQIPPHVIALDMIDRATLERSLFWPRDLPRGTGLLEVLARLVGEYNDFLDNFPH